MECSICLEKLNKNNNKNNNNKNIEILNCGHQIHKKCLNNLIKINEEWSYKCPLCRNKFNKINNKINHKINDNIDNINNIDNIEDTIIYEKNYNISNNLPIPLLQLLLFNVVKKNNF
tara:strand:+ start:85 stop:435 length:351 start_codon:yes stop_codon:yes gene_type:complete